VVSSSGWQNKHSNILEPPYNRLVLVETALLGQGLPSINNSQIARLWPVSSLAVLVWLEQGKIVTGGINDFLRVRADIKWRRVDGCRLNEAMREASSGYLTASAVMRVAVRTGAVIVVTAGMGGIRGNVVSDDLECLSTLPVLLIATSPKDHVNIRETLQYLKRNRVKVIGNKTNICNGFLFSGENILLDGINKGKNLPELSTGKKGCLLLNPLPSEFRMSDYRLLEQAVEEGEMALRRHQEYHPAVNAALDRFTNGRSSLLQLQALVANIKVALGQ
jgi:pseudouridine-5'-phosphate glycosidase